MLLSAIVPTFSKYNMYITIIHQFRGNIYYSVFTIIIILNPSETDGWLSFYLSICITQYRYLIVTYSQMFTQEIGLRRYHPFSKTSFSFSQDFGSGLGLTGYPSFQEKTDTALIFHVFFHQLIMITQKKKMLPFPFLSQVFVKCAFDPDPDPGKMTKSRFETPLQAVFLSQNINSHNKNNTG